MPSYDTPHKPTEHVYVVVIESDLKTQAPRYLRANKAGLRRCETTLSICGSVLTKKQADALMSDPSIAGTGAVDIEVPWDRVIRIQNATYTFARSQAEPQ